MAVTRIADPEILMRSVISSASTLRSGRLNVGFCGYYPQPDDSKVFAAIASLLSQHDATRAPLVGRLGPYPQLQTTKQLWLGALKTKHFRCRSNL